MTPVPGAHAGVSDTDFSDGTGATWPARAPVYRISLRLRVLNIGDFNYCCCQRAGPQASASLSRDAQPCQSSQPSEKTYSTHDPLMSHDHLPTPQSFSVAFAPRVGHLFFLWPVEPQLQQPSPTGRPEASEPCAFPHRDEWRPSPLGCFHPPHPKERAPRRYSSIAAHLFRDISYMSCTTRYGSLLASLYCTRRRTSSRKSGGVRPAIIALARMALVPFTHRPFGTNTAGNLRSWRNSWTFSCVPQTLVRIPSKLVKV